MADDNTTGFARRSGRPQQSKGFKGHKNIAVMVTGYVANEDAKKAYVEGTDISTGETVKVRLQDAEEVRTPGQSKPRNEFSYYAEEELLKDAIMVFEGVNPKQDEDGCFVSRWGISSISSGVGSTVVADNISYRIKSNLEANTDTPYVDFTTKEMQTKELMRTLDAKDVNLESTVDMLVETMKAGQSAISSTFKSDGDDSVAHSTGVSSHVKLTQGTASFCITLAPAIGQNEAGEYTGISWELTKERLMSDERLGKAVKAAQEKENTLFAASFLSSRMSKDHLGARVVNKALIAHENAIIDGQVKFSKEGFASWSDDQSKKALFEPAYCTIKLAPEAWRQSKEGTLDDAAKRDPANYTLGFAPAIKKDAAISFAFGTSVGKGAKTRFEERPVVATGAPTFGEDMRASKNMGEAVRVMVAEANGLSLESKQESSTVQAAPVATAATSSASAQSEQGVPDNALQDDEYAVADDEMEAMDDFIDGNDAGMGM